MSSSAQEKTDSHNLIPAFSSGQKISDWSQMELWKILQTDPKITSRTLQERLSPANDISCITIRHINRVRARFSLSAPKGRPKGKLNTKNSSADIIKIDPNISSVGTHIFSHWIEEQSAIDRMVDLVMARIIEYREQFPDAHFPLLFHSRDTIKKRLQAIFFAPLLNINKLVEFDRFETPLNTMIGQGYQSSTMNQFLGQLERIDAGESLMPLLGVGASGKLNYVDGHMVAYWNKSPMHKGKITMLGRVMAGSQAVVSHDDNGHGCFIEYYPPDAQMPQFLIRYCLKVVECTGNKNFVIDRAANSIALARDFDENKIGLLCMLNDDQYTGEDSFKTTLILKQSDGTKLYKGVWADERQDDPRQFVLTCPEAGKTLVYWATTVFSKEYEAKDWPSLYRARNDIQEKKFKRMKSRGFDVNHGCKMIIGPDRHQLNKKKAITKLQQGNEKKQNKIIDKISHKEDQVNESKAKGHGKRLKQRELALSKLEGSQKSLKENETKLSSDFKSLGDPKTRADRDFSKQLIMGIRSVLLENMLNIFHASLIFLMGYQVSLEMMLDLFFERSGVRIETLTAYIYLINLQGCSKKNRELLSKMVIAITAMNLKSNGKTIRVETREKPP